MKLFENQKRLDLENFIDYDGPIRVLDVVSKIPLIGSKNLQD